MAAQYGRRMLLKSVVTPEVQEQDCGIEGIQVGDLELNRPFGGKEWWNSMYFTNFPPLKILSKEFAEKYKGTKFYQNMDVASLAENGMYVTWQAAREDMILNCKLSKKKISLSAEVMQYEGQRVIGWPNFPLTDYIPKRDNHTPYEHQRRRFWDNGAIFVGLNAMEYSEVVAPVQGLEAYIQVADYVGRSDWGYYFTTLTINGWPWRVKKLGCFDGLGSEKKTRMELHTGFDPPTGNPLMRFLEGDVEMGPTGPNGEMETKENARKGKKYFAQLCELDFLGQKNDDSKLMDPEVPEEKGYVWFSIIDTVVTPNGQKGVKVQILDEGILPAWLELKSLQLWAGTTPLGFLNSAESDDNTGKVTCCRVVEQGRKIVTETEACRLVHSDPAEQSNDDTVDMGWAIRDICYKGAVLNCGPREGAWVADAGTDEGNVDLTAKPPLLVPGVDERGYWGYKS